MCFYTLRRNRDVGTNNISHKAEKREKQLSSRDLRHSNVQKSDATYLDLDPSSRHPQPVYQEMKGSESHSKDTNSSPVSNNEYQNISQTDISSGTDNTYLHLDISSKEPQSTYQDLTIPDELMNSEMYTELDPTSKSTETEYQDVILSNSYLDEDSEYQVVLNDNLENTCANYRSKVPNPPSVKRSGAGIQDTSIYSNIKNE